MAKLYPSWIEIPVSNLERAMTFYRAVFNLDDIPVYEDYPPARIAVLLPSEKSVLNPGVSLVQSPLRTSQAVFYALSFFQLDGFAVPTPAQVTQAVGR